MQLELDPVLLEESVFLAMRRIEQTGDQATFLEYRRRVDGLYELDCDDQQRQIAFRDVYAEFFRTLGFEQTLRDSLAEFPLLAAQLDRVCFRKVASRKQEGSELFVRDGDSDDQRHRAAVVGLSAELFVDRDRLLALLRRELYHVADMVDPAFGYRPRLGPAGETIASESLVRDRYRALWSVYIAVRLVRDGRAAAETLRREEALLDKALAGLQQPDREALCRTARDAESLTHADLLRMAKTGLVASPSPAAHVPAAIR